MKMLCAASTTETLSKFFRLRPHIVRYKRFKTVLCPSACLSVCLSLRSIAAALQRRPAGLPQSGRGTVGSMPRGQRKFRSDCTEDRRSVLSIGPTVFFSCSDFSGFDGHDVHRRKIAHNSYPFVLFLIYPSLHVVSVRNFSRYLVEDK